jgi:hypothetical protein
MSATRRIARVPVPDLCCLWAETPTAPMNMALIGVLDTAELTGDADASGAEVLRRVREVVRQTCTARPCCARCFTPRGPARGARSGRTTAASTSPATSSSPARSPH